jgi:hypothetical protein
VSGEITQTAAGRRVHAVLVAATVVMAVVAGVSVYLAVAGSDDPSRALPAGTTTSTSASSTMTAPSTSASPSPKLNPPLLPAAAAEPSRDGASAFLRYFFEVYTYTYASLDTQPMTTISLSGCDTCDSVVDRARAAASAGYTVEPGRIEISTIVAAPGNPNDGLVVSALIQQEPVVTRDRTGEVIDRTTATRNARIDARVIWSGTGWRMRAARIVGSPS